MAAKATGKYRVYYFDVRGRCEPLRWVFLAAKVPNWDDVRVAPEEWLELKNRCPTGTLPICDLPDGRRIGQQFSILKYLGRTFGMAGKDLNEQSMVISVLEHIDKLGEVCRTAGFSTDEEMKARLLKDLQEIHIPACLDPLEEMLAVNGGSGNWIVGNKLTIADISMAHWWDENRVLLQLSFDYDWSRWPNVKAHQERVKNYPGIKEWVEKRCSIEKEVENLMAGIAALRSLSTSTVNYNR